MTRSASARVITVFDASKDEEIEYKLVTSEESDVSQGPDFNHLALLAARCSNKVVGDVATVVTPNGKRELEVLKLATIHDLELEENSPPPRPKPCWNSSAVIGFVPGL